MARWSRMRRRRRRFRPGRQGMARWSCLRRRRRRFRPGRQGMARAWHAPVWSSKHIHRPARLARGILQDQPEALQSPRRRHQRLRLHDTWCRFRVRRKRWRNTSGLADAAMRRFRTWARNQTPCRAGGRRASLDVMELLALGFGQLSWANDCCSSIVSFGAALGAEQRSRSRSSLTGSR